jgi:hypothetical protein
MPNIPGFPGGHGIPGFPGLPGGHAIGGLPGGFGGAGEGCKCGFGGVRGTLGQFN